MYTPFSKNNADLSKRAHELAIKKVYPQVFGVSPERLSFDEDTLLDSSPRGQVLDGEMGVDYVARLTVHPLSAPLQLTVQERFRRAQYAHFRDVTITEWNHNSGLPSELYKITSGIFLYGYLNETQDDFKESIALNVTALLLAIANGRLRAVTQFNPRTDQDFLCFDFDTLIDAEVVMYHYTPTKSVDYVLP